MPAYSINKVCKWPNEYSYTIYYWVKGIAKHTTRICYFDNSAYNYTPNEGMLYQNNNFANSNTTAPVQPLIKKFTVLPQNRTRLENKWLARENMLIA